MILAVNSLPQVIANLQSWILGIALSLATLVLVYAGFLRVTSAGDTTQIERAKEAFKNALYGYALAVLAPVLLQILKGIVGG